MALTLRRPPSTRGGGRRSLAAAVGMQSPHFCLGLAPVGAVMLSRGSTGADNCPPAAFRFAYPEPVGSGRGDQPGQPGNGTGRVPVGGRPALYQVNVPLLVVVADQLLVDRVPGEQRVEPFGDLGRIATVRR